MRRKLYLETFGCQMNALDSELVLGQLRAQGYESVDERDEADVIIYNTCSVREHAEQKVWSRLGELRDRKRREPGLVIGVIGCMAERDGKNIFQRHPHVDILCGPGELDKLSAMVHNAVVTGGEVGVQSLEGSGGEFRVQSLEFSGGAVGVPRSESLDCEGECAPATGPGELSPQSASDSKLQTLNSPPSRKRQVALMGANIRRSSTLAAAEDHLELLDLSRSFSPADDVTQAYVRITRGCNKFCTYCVVPYTRGPEVHRPPQNIIDEVRRLSDAGAKEVTLLGQTINHYHYAHGDGRSTTFAELLYQIHESVPDLPRLRFVTSFPRDFSDEALQAMRDCPRICRYLHVPAQHGSDRILKLMNRGYTAQQYRDFIGRAREMMPDLSIASDFIVGFPTETEEEFEQAVEMVHFGRFKNSFIFKYSPRPGTVAIERFADDVPEDVKKVRNNRLLTAQAEVSAENNRLMVGKTVEVLVEGESKLAARKAYPTSGVELGWEQRKGQTANAARVQLTGRTRGDQVVVFDGDRSLKGKLVDVEIIDARNMTLFARAVAHAEVLS